MVLRYVVDEATSGKAIKYILKTKLDISERLVKKMKLSGRILCNSIPVFVNAIVKTGDIVEAYIDFNEEESDIIPENIPLDIIYEDECLLAINKQPNMVVHPTCSHQSGTVANGITYYLGSKGINKKIRPVSRLDRDTSGIIIFAKNEFVQESLIRQMANKDFKKEYLGIVHGLVPQKEGTISLPIERKPDSIMLRHVSHSGAHAVTHYEVIEYLSNASYIRFFLETGRTHQIRVHCQAINHPLIGDTLYPYLDKSSQTNHSEYETQIKRQALHSCTAVFIHPITGKITELSAPMPQDMVNLLEILRK